MKTNKTHPTRNLIQNRITMKRLTHVSIRLHGYNPQIACYWNIEFEHRRLAIIWCSLPCYKSHKAPGKEDGML